MRNGCGTVYIWPFFEDPRSNLQGISDRREFHLIQIRSLTPRQAIGNTLAFAVQEEHIILFQAENEITVANQGFLAYLSRRCNNT